MNAKKEMTYKSIEQAVDNGAKTMSQIAVAHGYKRPISSGTIRKIRRISPMVDCFLHPFVIPEDVTAINQKICY